MNRFLLYTFPHIRKKKLLGPRCIKIDMHVLSFGKPGFTYTLFWYDSYHHEDIFRTYFAYFSYPGIFTCLIFTQKNLVNKILAILILTHYIIYLCGVYLQKDSVLLLFIWIAPCQQASRPLPIPKMVTTKTNIITKTMAAVTMPLSSLPSLKNIQKSKSLPMRSPDENIK